MSGDVKLETSKIYSTQKIYKSFEFKVRIENEEINNEAIMYVSYIPLFYTFLQLRWFSSSPCIGVKLYRRLPVLLVATFSSLSYCLVVTFQTNWVRNIALVLLFAWEVVRPDLTCLSIRIIKVTDSQFQEFMIHFTTALHLAAK